MVGGTAVYTPRAGCVRSPKARSPRPLVTAKRCARTQRNRRRIATVDRVSRDTSPTSREIHMKRLTLAVLLAVLALPAFADEQAGMDRQLTTISDVWSSDFNFIAPPQ